MKPLYILNYSAGDYSGAIEVKVFNTLKSCKAAAAVIKRPGFIIRHGSQKNTFVKFVCAANKKNQEILKHYLGAVLCTK